MKKIVFFLILSMVITFSAEAHRHRNHHVTISLQTFYDELSPYGDWIYTPEYGYVWQPYFDNPEGFRPYSSNGDWAYTEYGWTWVSDYRWGWAPFHYGRWTFDDYLGWMWIPGLEWAPAWVSWGSYGDCWGWAPLGPGINININLNWFAPDLWWTFVPRLHFGSHNWHSHIYDRPVHVTHITNITNIYYGDNNRKRNSNSWYSGPRVNDVERYNRSKVRTMRVVDAQRPENLGARDQTLNVYRPGVEKSLADARPQEYRKMESNRNGARIVQTNPRTVDPGVNRSREERNKPHTSTPISVERNTSQPTVNPGREATKPEREVRTNETTRPVESPSRVTKPENRERNSTPANENANRNTSRETKERQAIEARPSRERETPKATPKEKRKSESSSKKQERKSSGEKQKKESSRSASRR